MIYEYIKNTNNKTLFVSLLIFLSVIIIFLKTNFNSNYFFAIPIALFISIIYISYTKYNSKIDYSSIENKVKDLPLLTSIKNYPDFIDIYYDSRILLQYSNFIHFKKSIEHLREFLQLHKFLTSNDQLIKFEYKLLVQNLNNCVETFEYMHFNIPHVTELIKIYNQQLNKLKHLLKIYLNKIIDINNKNIENTGYDIYTKYLYKDEFL